MNLESRVLILKQEQAVLAIVKETLNNQYEAVFCSMAACVDRCPEQAWTDAVGNWQFNQVAFHALFFTDLYLGNREAELKLQPFHKQHNATFGNYEELDDGPPTVSHEREFVRLYLDHCRRKAGSSIGSETEQSLARAPGFDWLKFSRLEVHAYNIRHAYHHVAQLSLKLRNEHDIEVPWIGTRWKNLSEQPPPRS